MIIPSMPAIRVKSDTSTTTPWARTSMLLNWAQPMDRNKQNLWNVASGWTWVISPSTVNQFNAQYITFTHDNQYPACPLPTTYLGVNLGVDNCLPERVTFPSVSTAVANAFPHWYNFEEEVGVQGRLLQADGTSCDEVRVRLHVDADLWRGVRRRQPRRHRLLRRSLHDREQHERQISAGIPDARSRALDQRDDERRRRLRFDEQLGRRFLRSGRLQDVASPDAESRAALRLLQFPEQPDQSGDQSDLPGAERDRQFVCVGVAVARPEQHQSASWHGVGYPRRWKRRPASQLWAVLHADSEELNLSAGVSPERRACTSRKQRRTPPSASARSPTMSTVSRRCRRFPWRRPRFPQAPTAWATGTIPTSKTHRHSNPTSACRTSSPTTRCCRSITRIS